MSGTVRDLVAGSGIPSTEPGHHAPKGLPGGWLPCAVGDGAGA